MSRGIRWYGDAWDEYCEWQLIDKAMIKRINALIKDARRNPFVGIGNPEPLKNDLSGVWSRRINETDRLTYCLEDDILLNYPMDKARGFLTDHENLLFKLRPPAWEMVAPALKYCVD